MNAQEILTTIRAEIERIYEDIVSNNIDCHPTTVLDEILSFLDTLDSEKPNNHEELDEAAHEYVTQKKNNWLGDDAWEFVFYAFKAGAEWAMAQGVTAESKIGQVGNTKLRFLNTATVDPLLKDFPPGIGVYVQIRKK